MKLKIKWAFFTSILLLTALNLVPQEVHSQQQGADFISPEQWAPVTVPSEGNLGVVSIFFDIDASGKTTNMIVDFASPSDFYIKHALQGVSSWVFDPKYEGADYSAIIEFPEYTKPEKKPVIIVVYEPW